MLEKRRNSCEISISKGQQHTMVHVRLNRSVVYGMQLVAVGSHHTHTRLLHETQVGSCMLASSQAQAGAIDKLIH